MSDKQQKQSNPSENIVMFQEDSTPKSTNTVKRTMTRSQGLLQPGPLRPGELPQFMPEQTGNASSTPATSPCLDNINTPSNPLNLVREEAYQTTPLAESAGTVLISQPDALIPIEGNCSEAELGNRLDSINSHIDHNFNILTSDPSNKGEVNSKYKSLLNSLHKVRYQASLLKSCQLILRCSELSDKLDQLRSKCSVVSANSSRSSFHGFPSSVHDKSDRPITPHDADGEQLIVLHRDRMDKLDRRVSDLENKRIRTRELKKNYQDLDGQVTEINKAIENQLIGISSNSDNISVLTTALSSLNDRMEVVEEQVSHTIKLQAEDSKSMAELKCLLHTLSQDLSKHQMSTTQEIQELQDTVQDILTNLSTKTNTIHAGTQPISSSGHFENLPSTSNAPLYTTAHMPTSLTSERVSDWLRLTTSTISRAQTTYPSTSNPHVVVTSASTQPNQQAPNATGFLNIQEIPHSRSSTAQGLQQSGRRETNYNPQGLLTPNGLSSIHEEPNNRNQENPNEGRHSNSGDSDSQTVSHLDFYGKTLNRLITSLRRFLSPALNQPITKSMMMDIYKNHIPMVESKATELNRSLEKYIMKPTQDAALVERAQDLLEDAQLWTDGMRQRYTQQGYHMKSQTAKLYENLPKFTERSEIDIFEYLRQYESLSQDFDIPGERAELLYSKYLSSSIQDEVFKYKADYEAMKRILLQRYGDLQTITSNILSPVLNDSVPRNSADISTKLIYCRKLQSALQKIDKLLRSPDVSTCEVKDYIYSHEFLKKLLKIIPEAAFDTFVDRMQELDEDTNRVKGKNAFKLILSSVNKIYDKYDSMARNTELPPSYQTKKDKEKPGKSVKHVHSSTKQEQTTSESESEIETRSAYFQTKPPQKENLRKKHDTLKFPCIISGHKHSISSCNEFFLKTPKERVEARRELKFKICTLCLQSSDACRTRKCAHLKSIPDVLICKECKEVAKDKKKSWHSVLYCFSEGHTKPPGAEVLSALEKYLPDFKSSHLKAPINMACHFQVLGASKQSSKPATLSRSPDISIPVPIFNTSTGIEEEPRQIDLIQEVCEDSISIMQVLKIRGKSVLTLFDRGANQHLINGKLGEELSLKVLSDEPSTIGVIKGGKIWTEYGMYQFYLGPTPEGKFHELKAQGISVVTGEFPKYDLTETNKESIESTDIGADACLPAYIGGGRIDLLIGLKNCQLDPVCIFTLPSGLGLYKSPFKDAFGSYYCYGGPHSSFTKINNEVGGTNVNHITVYFGQMINSYKNSLYSSLMKSLEPEIIDNEYGVSFVKDTTLDYSYRSSSGQDIYPTPLSSEDFVELGQSVTDEKDFNSQSCAESHCDCPPLPHIFKAKIPLNKQREFLDEADADSTINYRCAKCLRCKCSTTSRSKMISLTEAIEQEAIEKSVHIDLEQKKVFVDLPFTKPPEEFLTSRHGDDNNYKQALRVYKTQCRQPEARKEGIRNVHKDLVSRGFLKKLTDLPPEQQNLINSNAFRHYMPWRIVLKESASTPIRLVVDPTMSGLNVILAKGENRMKKINDILLRARTKKFLWSSDISKLYNCLHLQPSSYPYQLFLFHDSLDPEKEPSVYVMVRAWYGVTSSANQSGYALEELARLLRDDNPLAYVVITESTFVDDMLNGTDTVEECDEEIQQVQNVLDAGGFKSKYIVQSCQLNEEKVIKILGYKWNIEEDKLSPGFSELNFNKKKRGMKVANPFPVVDAEDVDKILPRNNITRRMVVSKIAEIWEPAGFWEPYKLQLKLSAQTLNGVDWDTPLNEEQQTYWRKRFKEMLQVPLLAINRYIFKDTTDRPHGIRLLCISDAAANAGGAAVYAGVELQDGTYSCQLLTSKSKLMSESVPRNELEAIRLAANLAFDVKQALRDNIQSVIFFTDSSIAMAWCHNTKKKLRLFCLNRVSEIRRLIESVAGKHDDLPLYHIDGKSNPADLLTKPNAMKPEDLSEESIWISGYAWMKLHLNEMPITTFADIQVSASHDELINQECFPEIVLPSHSGIHFTNACPNQAINEHNSTSHCHGCKMGASVLECYGYSEANPHCIDCNCQSKTFSFAGHGGKGSLPFVNIIKEGYQKSINIVARMIDFVWTLKHKIHIKKGNPQSGSCHLCTALSQANGVISELDKVFKSEALNYFLQLESEKISKALPKDKLSKYQIKDGIYYMVGRLPEDSRVPTVDLDYSVFFDNTDIKGILPVVSAESDFFFSLVLHVHEKVRKHSSNEATMREIMKKVYPIHNPKRIIQAVRKNCPRCRLITRKTLELEMGNHPQSRYQICPAFYHSMADIVYGFQGKPFKTSRTQIKVYALVIVCLLTSATSILALEGIETQDVIAALERHSARHGVPSTIFVDMGTQLTCLEKVKLSIRDAHLQLKDSLGLRIIPSTAKSHEERGRVERKIRTLRDMLKKVAVSTSYSLTPMQWETVFAKLASEIDDIPMAKADKTSTDLGWDLLTPNRFKLGRANNRAIEGPITLSENSTPIQLLHRIRDIQSYWYELLLDRIHHLVPRSNKWSHTDAVQSDDIVIFRFKDNASSKLETWKIGKVIELQNDGRKLLIAYPRTNPAGKTVLSSVLRSPRDVSVISAATDLPLNSEEFFKQIRKAN